MSQTTTGRELADLLGYAAAEGDVARAVKQLGLRADALSQFDCEQVLSELGKQSGVQGMTARFARAQVPLLFADKITSAAETAQIAASTSGLRSMELFGAKKKRHRRVSMRTQQAMKRIDRVRYGRDKVVELFSAGSTLEEATEAVNHAIAKLDPPDPESLSVIEIDRMLNFIEELGPRWVTEVKLVRARIRSGGIDL